MKALMLGAFDFVGKPEVDTANSLNQYASLIREKVKSAALAKFAYSNTRNTGDQINSSRDSDLQPRRPGKYNIIAIGASTGGVEAIHELLKKLPDTLPPILVTQHIPPVFSASFARRLNDQLRMTVCEAKDGQKLLPGRVYVSPGDKHLVLATDGNDHLCRLQSGPPVNRHIPSVDVLFRSVAGVCGASAIGILLTGMGNDGALGLAAMRNEGAITIAQDKNSSVVWGMPREAINLGAANFILPLNKISEKLFSLHSNRNYEKIQCQK